MNKEKETFDNITTKLVIAQLFKSSMIMRIVSLKTNSHLIMDTSSKYSYKLTKLTDNLARIHYGVIGKKEIDDLPPCRYIDPVEHINDISYYISSNRKLFNTPQELSVIDEILKLISLTKNQLTLG